MVDYSNDIWIIDGEISDKWIIIKLLSGYGPTKTHEYKTTLAENIKLGITRIVV